MGENELESEKINSKKTFFLFTEKKEQLWLEKKMFEHEYESYFLDASIPVRDLLEHFADSILIINTLNVPSAVNISDMLNSIKGRADLACTPAGAIIKSDTVDHDKFDFFDFKIVLKNNKGTLQCDVTFASILETLNRYKVMGRRKFLRIRCTDNYSATISLKIGKEIISGFIKDISSAGVCAYFSESLTLSRGQFLLDIQLRLHGILCYTEGKVMGSQGGDSRCWIILFDFSSPSRVQDKEKIQSFIRYSMKKELDEIIHKLGSS